MLSGPLDIYLLLWRKLFEPRGGPIPSRDKCSNFLQSSSGPWTCIYLCNFLAFFFFFLLLLLLLRRPISPGCVLSISPPPSSPARRRCRATSTAWRSSRAVRSSCPIMTTWSTVAAPASSAQVNTHLLPSATSCILEMSAVCVLACVGVHGALYPLHRKTFNLIYASE